MWLASLLLITIAGTARADNDFLVKEWENVVADTALMKQAPSNGIVKDQEQFEKIWKSWKIGDKAAPKIDFDMHFVFVYANRGTKHMLAQFLRDTGIFYFVICKGEKYKSTAIDGFHYQIVVVKKDQVKGLGEKPFILNGDTGKLELPK